ncbi:MAG: HAD-IIA family hydrolase [Clostridia bacterium]|nr:HAD-IIA family hydrolase [Clostridia bacterium]
MEFINPNINEIANKKLYIFDMDGTIYLGGIVFDFAIKFIENLRASGRRVLFFTNNASHTTEFYYSKLERLGFSPREGEIMTSGDVTIEYLKNHRAGKSVYLIGTDELVDDFKRRGINLVDEDAENCDIVVSSFDTTLTYEKLNAACRFVRDGAEYLSTHPDFNCPVENGFIPDSGAIAAFITASTGKTPTYFGKPYKETVEMIEEVCGVDRKDTVIFGDRLYTDIALGKKHGVCAVLVLSGETLPEDVEAASDAEKPDFVFNSLDDVNKSMFEVE